MGIFGVSLKPLKRAFGISKQTNMSKPRAEDDEALASSISPCKGGLLSPSSSRIQNISNDVVQVVDGKTSSYVFVPEIFEAPGASDGEHMIELVMTLEGGRVVPIIKARVEGHRFSDGDAFVVKKCRSKVPLARGKMTLKVCKVLEDGGLAAPLESFSFNFKLNSGIHGLSNVGVKGETDSFAIMDLKSSVTSREAMENETPDVYIDGVSFFVDDSRLDY